MIYLNNNIIINILYINLFEAIIFLFNQIKFLKINEINSIIS